MEVSAPPPSKNAGHSKQVARYPTLGEVLGLDEATAELTEALSQASPADIEQMARDLLSGAFDDEDE